MRKQCRCYPKWKKLIWLTIAAILVFSASLVWNEISLECAQRDFSALLEQNSGNYNDGRVVLSPTTKAEAQAMAEVFGGTLRITKDGSFAVINLPEGVTLSDIAENNDYRKYHDKILLDYNNFSITEEVIQDTGLRANYQVHDLMYPQQTYLDYLNIDNTWNVTLGRDSAGEKVTVAIIDTGIDTDHPEFYDANGKSIISTSSYDATNDKVVDQYDISVIEDTHGHGTAVAGVIAAQMNGAGTVGIAPEVELLVIRCEADEAGEFRSSSDIVFAVYYAIEMDVDVVNMSLGGIKSEDLAKALQLAVDSDIICVAAAGNDATDEPYYPAAYDTVIGVGALANESWEIADYSNYGVNSDIMAPGTVLAPEIGGGYTYHEGTSMATPIVSAAAALYVSQNRYATYESLKVDLLAAGKDLGDPGEDHLYGFGALDIHAFVREEKGTITYDYCTEEIENTEQVFVRRHTIQTVPEPERENIVFDDWYYDKAYTKVFDYDAWYSTEFVEDVTLYAKWVNEDDEGASVYNYRTLSDGTIEIVNYKGKRRYLTIPNEIDGKIVSSIGPDAFSGNTRLREVTFPEGLVYIKDGAFCGVSKMRAVTFTGSKLIEIQYEAFMKCAALRKLELPDSVKTIGASAFSGCSSLREVNITENSRLENVGRFAFEGTAISSFYIPKNVTASGFDGSILAYCSKMQMVRIHPQNMNFAVQHNTLYNSSKNTIVYYPAARSGAYTVADGVDTIGGYAFAGSAISELDLNAVVTIGEASYKSTKKLSSVVIPNTVTGMGREAFAGSSINQVTLSDNLTQISEGAFRGAKLIAIHVPAKVQEITSYAFQNCSYLQSLTFAEGSLLNNIGNAAFAGCAILSDFVFPDFLETIGEKAFSGCRTIARLDIPTKVNFVGEEAFAYCTRLKNVEFAPNGAVTVVPVRCFYGCTSLNSVTFSDSITELGAYAFCNDTALLTLSFGPNSSLTTVGDYCFYTCSALIDMQLPETVETIGRFAYAFSGLKKVNLSANVSGIGNAAFGACSSLTAITVSEENSVYAGVDNVLFSKDISVIYCVPASRSGGYTLPDTVKITAPYSFYYDQRLTSVILPNGLEDIQMNSFYSCSGLKEIEIPAQVTNIGRAAFEECHQLGCVTFEAGSQLHRLGIYTFVSCGFSEITIPASVEEIAQYAFYNCRDLQKITFEENSKLSYVAAYMLAGTNVQDVVFENGSALTNLQAHAFDGATKLVRVDFGDAKLTNVDNYAFYNCTKLEEIQLPETVTYIGRYAFYNCTRLKRMDIPAMTDYIGESAFANTNKLKVFFASDNLPANVQPDWDKDIAGYFLGAVDYVVTKDWEYSVRSDGTIVLADYKGSATELTIDTVDGYTVSQVGVRCFYNNDLLTSVTLSGNITQIGNYAFAGCDNLTAITVPSSVKTIGKHAFANSVIKVNLANDSALERIGDYAFSGNTTVSMSLPNTVTEIGNGAFLDGSLSELSISKDSKLKIIGEQAFVGSGIQEIYLPAALREVGAEAFKNVTNLTCVEIAGGSTELKLDNGAFEGCGIQDITIPARVWYIGEYTFGSCRNLQNIHVASGNAAYTSLDGVLCDISGTTLIQYPCGRSGAYKVPAKIKVLTYASFKNAKNLTQITFESGSTVKTIGWQTFNGCEKLQKITVPDSVVSFDFYAFENCASLTDVVLGNGSELTGVYEGAFYGCSSLKNITLPDAVEEIGEYAFYNCMSLPAIPLTKNAQVKSINDYAFSGCANIDRIPDFAQIAEIGECAFAYTNLSEYTVGASVKEIASNAFLGCQNFVCISCDESNESYVSINGALYEKGATDASDYSALVVWPYKNILTIGAGKTQITAEDTAILREVPDLRWEIADTVTMIGAEAFKDHINLKSVTIPEKIKTIGSLAFANCWSLEEIRFNAINMDNSSGNVIFSQAGKSSDGITLIVGSQVTKIPTLLCAGGMNLTFVAFEENSKCESIRKSAFAGCQSLSSIMIPASVTAIADHAFFGCSAIVIFEAGSLPGTLGTGWEGMTTAVMAPKEWGIVEDFFYCITADNTAILGRYTGCDTNVVIPEYVHDVPVAVMVGSFCNNIAVQKITIPDSVNEIGAYAFYGCKGMTKLSIPEGVTKIGKFAFSNCTNVEEFYFDAVTADVFQDSFSSLGADSAGVKVVIGNQVRNIPEHFLEYAENLISISFDSGSKCTGIGSYAFSAASKVSKITVPESVTVVGTGAFQNCAMLTSAGPVGGGYAFEFEWTDAIPAYAFGSNKYLKSVIIPDGITSIGEYAFTGTCVEKLSIPASVTNCFHAFSGCFSKKTAGPAGKGYDIEFGWTEAIPEGAFAGCNITEITLPDEITRIENKTFWGCSALAKIDFPDSLKEIGYLAFAGCKFKTLELPDSVTRIEDSAFAYNSYLEYLSLSDSLGCIGEDAFIQCEKLLVVEIPESVSDIGPSALSYATVIIIHGEDFPDNLGSNWCGDATIILNPKDSGITEAGMYYVVQNDDTVLICGYHGTESHVSIPSTISGYPTTSLLGTFRNRTDISYVDIPDSVTEIGAYAFYGCSGLSDIRLSNSLQTVGDYAFYKCSNLSKLSLPDEIQTIGSYAFYCCGNLSKLRLPNEVRTVGSYAFYGCSNLNELTLSNNLQEIGDYAFTCCSGITEIVFPESLHKIGGSAFYDCTGLEEILIPESVYSIGWQAFYRCTSVRKLTILGEVSLGPYVFKGCTLTTAGPIGGGYDYEFAWLSEIPDHAFADIDSLVSVTIPDGITRIGESAFYSCNLTDIVLPSSIRQIDESAFGMCIFEKILLPEGITKIGDYAFSSCRKLESINFPDSITSIGSYAFWDCKSLSSIILPNGITEIGESTFRGCDALDTIILSDSIEKVGPKAFAQNSSLTSIIIPQNVYEIGNDAFACSNLDVIFIKSPDIAKAITSASSCGSLTNQATAVLLSPDILEYGSYLTDNFQYCEDGVVVGGEAYVMRSEYSIHWEIEKTIQERVPCKQDGVYTYRCTDCDVLKEVVIDAHDRQVTASQSVTCMEDGWNDYRCRTCGYTERERIPAVGHHVLGFWYTPEGSTGTSYRDCKVCEYREVGYFTTIASGNCGRKANWVLDSNGLLYIYGLGKLDSWTYSTYAPWYDKRGMIVSVAIDDAIQSDFAYAFYGCNSLTTFDIPNGVTSVGECAFRGCSNLTSIGIPDSVTSISSSAFSGCSSLTNIEIPESVIRIGHSAFVNCSSLTSINIPDGITSIEFSIFAGCESLTKIDIPDGVIKIGNSAFSGCSSLTSINIPSGVTSIEYGSFSGCRSLTSIEIPDNVTSIGNSAFSGCSSLTSIELPESVTSIGNNAFRRCSSLCNIDLPDNITSIENETFQECSSLASITIPDGVTRIGDYAFDGCNSLSSVNIPDSVIIIGNDAFRKCSSLTSIDIPDSVISIGDYVFHDCSSLTSIALPNRIASIGTYAFRGCSSLTSINLPDSVTSIGSCAFYGCNNLTSIDFSDCITSIGDYAFNNCSSLTSIDLPDGITDIGNYAFQRCQGLTNIVFPDRVTNIGYDAFGNCSKLYSITFCGDLPALSNSTFYGVTATVYYPALNSTWTTEAMKNYGGTLTWLAVCNEHIWGEWFVNRSATCTEDGENRRNCQNCDHYETEIIPATGHEYTDTVIAPTCTEQGYTTHTCRCGDSYVSDHVPATGHDHKAVVTEPTCTEQGYTTHTCRCGDSYVDTYVDALGHDMGLWFLVTEATCTADGLEQRDCSRCDYQETQVIEAIGHDYEAVVTEPTCTGTGFTTHTCHCGDSYVSDYTDPLGHSFTDYISDGNATCTQDGTKTAVCNRCDVTDTVTDVGSAHGHDFSDWVVVEEPTQTSDGLESRYCYHCGLEETRVVTRLENPFNDVPEGSFYHAPVLWAVANGITNGTSATTFGPEDQCMRAHVVTFLWRAAGSPEPESNHNPFVDVKETDFYYKAVLWAVENGITNGLDATHFGPLTYCNRAQVVTFLWRAQGQPEPSGTDMPFTDVEAGAWYDAPIRWAVENGITNGMSGTSFGINVICNRAQIVTFLYRTYN